MTELDLAFALGFGLPVTIVGMILFYRLARFRITNRQEHERDRNEPQPIASQARLASRAADLQKRIHNLEDILSEEMDAPDNSSASASK